MDVTRLSIARVLELGVPISWQEAGALAFESVSQAQELGGSDPARVEPSGCLVTRGGEVVLMGDAARTHPEAMADLAIDLLAACQDPGELGAAVHAGQLLQFLEALGHDTTWKRRRVQIAALALRALAAEADRRLAEPDQPPVPSEPRVEATKAGATDMEHGATVSAGSDVRRFTRQTPRSPAGDVLVNGARRPAQRRPTRSAARSFGVSARMIIWTAVAASASVAGLGLWQVRIQPPPLSPVVTGPAAQSHFEPDAAALTPVALPVAVELPQAEP